MCRTFKYNLYVDLLAFIALATVLATFKKLGEFYSNLVTLIKAQLSFLFENKLECLQQGFVVSPFLNKLDCFLPSMILQFTLCI
jgi:hypothetical protein